MDAAWGEFKTALIPNFTLLVNDEVALIRGHNYIMLPCVPIKMHFQAANLFSKVTFPLRKNLGKRLFIVIDLVVGTNLQTGKAVALKFKVRVCDHDTVPHR